MKKMTLAAAVLALSAVGLAGCGADAPAPGSASSAAAEQAQSLTITGAWAKAADAGGMTGVFGTLKNGGAEDLTVVAASSPAAASVELHETAAGADGAMTMQEIDGGFIIPAGGEYLLEPGASHLMLMGLEDGLLAGDTLPITLELADGSTTGIEVIAKDFAGANENYGDDAADADHTHGAEDTDGAEHTHGTEHTDGTEHAHGTEDTHGTVDH
ncbi:copper chaperone PCu(A)C [Arthrobacter sp. Sa2CUA1]|uniref:Copper chaperone PCu(A)C n=1 Tax=Arthrobacter gallicola TaxID=2762225 RepID=A0ABR8USQ9_9MICC|nr:copper chaperone PCu(A)C [Arthrobacter gallicola]MBD7995606.1 copper chaperone PCu(A)C [Arthrobacter gallicola]